MSDLSVAGELTAVPSPAPAPSPTPPAPAPGSTAPTPAPVDPNAVATAPPANAPVPPVDDGLKLPGKDAKPEDWKAFYAKVGAPENADGYKLEVPEGGDPEFAKQAAGWFAEAGLRPDQAEKLNKAWNAKAVEVQALMTAAAQAKETEAAAASQAKAKVDDAALRNEFQGEAYTKMKENAGKAMREFFPGDKEQQVAALSALESVYGYGGLYRLLNKLGTGLAEGSLRGGDGNKPGAQVPLKDKMFGDALAKAGIKPAQ